MHKRLPSDEEIAKVIWERHEQSAYPLTIVSEETDLPLLTGIVREKLGLLLKTTNYSLRSYESIVEALNHAVMSPRWLNRNGSQ